MHARLLCLQRASACVVFSRRPIPVRFRGIPAFIVSVISTRKSESDPKQSSLHCSKLPVIQSIRRTLAPPRSSTDLTRLSKRAKLAKRPDAIGCFGVGAMLDSLNPGTRGSASEVSWSDLSHTTADGMGLQFFFCKNKKQKEGVTCFAP